MTESGTRIVIRHLSGSKVNQIDQFDLAGLQEITLGRDPKSTVAYDVARDDEVSRRHAVIRIKNDKELYFRIADLNSSNGTMLNGERIGGEVELLPDDVVELGSGGPKFTFDVQPRPASLPSRTRAMGALDAAATRVVAATNAEAATAERSAVPETQERGVATTGTMSSTPARTPVGKATILRMLTDERRSTRQIWIAALAAVLVLAIIGGGAIWWHGQNVATQLQQQVASQAARTEAIRTEAADALSKTIGLTPADIKRLGDATVYIHNQWQLYDRDSNRPIFQKMTKVGDEWLPAYVRLDDGKLVRWLTLDNDKTNFYKPVGKDHSGSGFVISDQGFILTNKHVAAGWTSEYEDFPYYNWTRGSVYGIRQDRHDTERNVNQVRSLTDWVPESGGYLFESGRPYPITNSVRDFFGRNEVLTVQFPGTRIGINANLLRTSIDADVAEIKVDSTQSLSKLDLADDNSVQIGQRIALLGYPGVSQETIAVQQSSEGGRVRERAIYIPEPTVTEGIVAKMPTRKDRKDQGGGVTTYGTTGDTYQLDIFAGPGHSGGPVLDSTGKVIALLSLVSTTAQHVSFAVPVSYVRELLQPQRNASP
ncbi:MAG TPA: trypsin-like peptidase domain-containing protein [Xanthobacteraceae bacterium]|nr:trypsin-like peptidase domain-containing protein [Xanthobacteraceae bacterium]